jgi:fructose-bisphosphate aldolase class 1
VKDIIPVAEPEPQPQPSFDSVSKIDELAREDLKKEMKMLKETRESK